MIMKTFKDLVPGDKVYVIVDTGLNSPRINYLYVIECNFPHIYLNWEGYDYGPDFLLGEDSEDEPAMIKRRGQFWYSDVNLMNKDYLRTCTKFLKANMEKIKNTELELVRLINIQIGLSEIIENLKKDYEDIV